MKYFEKQAGLPEILKGIKKGVLDAEGAIAKVTQIELKRNRLLKLKHTKPDLYYSPQVRKRKAAYSADIVTANLAINKMASTTSPFQGTMLNVQTREAQRKYKSKILGKKKADVLVPLWLNSSMM
jgi:hypothetical protein